MEIYKLNSDTFKPTDIVTGLSSYHWEDKFTSAGSVTLETPHIRQAMELIPPETYLGNSVDDTVMYIEKHSVTTDNGIPKLTITGRSGQAFLESRFAVERLSNGISEESHELNDYRVYELMRAVLRSSRLTTPSGFNYNLGFPYTYIQPDTRVGPLIEDFEVPRQSVFKILSDLSEAYGVSFRMLRKINSTSDIPVTMSFMPGYIRTNKSSPMFSYANGDILNERFVWDVTNRADFVTAFTPIASSSYAYTNYKGHYTHRAKMVDRPESEPKDLMQYGNLGITDPLTWLKSLMDSMNNLEIRYYQQGVVKTQARLYFQAAQKTKKYSFDISTSAKAKYGVEYNLGDIVTVHSSFSDMVDMRVSSYIRTMDESGYNEYPVLEEYNPLNERIELS